MNIPSLKSNEHSFAKNAFLLMCHHLICFCNCLLTGTNRQLNYETFSGVMFILLTVTLIIMLPALAL